MGFRGIFFCKNNFSKKNARKKFVEYANENFRIFWQNFRLMETKAFSGGGY